MLIGSSVGIGLGFGDGSSVDSVGGTIAVGDSLRLLKGFGEGSSAGDVIGWAVTTSLGMKEGSKVGIFVCFIFGFTDGFIVCFVRV